MLSVKEDEALELADGPVVLPFVKERSRKGE
jgi:hypothetical protein